jgi:hypothetical protein
MWASYNGDTTAVRDCLSTGEDFTWTYPPDRSTPLYWASRRGHADVVRLLLEAGACPQGKTVQGWTALMAACYQGHTEAVLLLLSTEAGHAVLEEQDQEGRNALYFAVRYNNVGATQALLQHGADIRSLSHRLAAALRRRLGLCLDTPAEARVGSPALGSSGTQLSTIAPRCFHLLQVSPCLFCGVCMSADTISCGDRMSRENISGVISFARCAGLEHIGEREGLLDIQSSQAAAVMQDHLEWSLRSRGGVLPIFEGVRGCKGRPYGEEEASAGKRRSSRPSEAPCRDVVRAEWTGW